MTYSQPISRTVALRVAERLEQVAHKVSLSLEDWGVLLEELLPEAYSDDSLPETPTQHHPGSGAKQSALHRRAMAGTSLHHPEDDRTIVQSENTGDRGGTRVSVRGHYKGKRPPGEQGKRKRNRKQRKQRTAPAVQMEFTW